MNGRFWSTVMSVRNVFAGTWKYALGHKVISGIVLVALLGGGYYAYGRLTSTSGVTRYIVGTVATGTIVASVSGSGQISAGDSVDIKPQVSGTLTWVGVKPGDVVRAGQAIATIDNADAKQAIADAKKNLAADQLNFQKSSAQAPVDYKNDVQALATAKENLQDDYNDTFNDLTATYLDLPDVVSGSENVLYGYDLAARKDVWNKDVLINLFNTKKSQDVDRITSFQTSAVNDYTTARTAYDASISIYQQTTRTSNNDSMDTLLAQSITMTTAVAQALQSELNFLGTASDLAQTYNLQLPSYFSTLQSNTRSLLSTANSDLSTLLSDKKTLDAAKQAITNAQQTITLDQVGNPDGNNPISLQVSQNSIEKEQQDLAKMESDLADYTIVAPFAGTISVVNAKTGDSAGSSAIATIISKTQVAELSLNEVDATKIKLGQKATLNFDAIDGLTLTGTVAEIDTVGTVTQGVVSYDIKIALDAQDARVKPGMTVNADIQTDVHQNVLTVPASAVKTQGGSSYVQVFSPVIDDGLVQTAGTQGIIPTTPPQNIPVTVGISDDTNTEITSGLTGGEQIVVRTTTSAKTTTPAAAATTRTTGAGAAGARGAAGGFGGGAAIRL